MASSSFALLVMFVEFVVGLVVVGFVLRLDRLGGRCR
jgi:hypothetical protein